MDGWFGCRPCAGTKQAFRHDRVVAFGNTDVAVVVPLALAVAPGGALTAGGAGPAAVGLVPATAHTAWRHVIKGFSTPLMNLGTQAPILACSGPMLLLPYHGLRGALHLQSPLQ